MEFQNKQSDVIESLVLIGASTGGPGRIGQIIGGLPPEFSPAIIIAQHMAELFIPSFVKQIQSMTLLFVHEATKPTPLLPGNIYVCSVTSQLTEESGRIILKPLHGEHFPYNPFINPLFASAASLGRSTRKLGIVLTGIGDDGAEGSLALFRAGGECLFENEQSAIVYGMPKRALELVPSAQTGDIDTIVRAIVAFGKR